MQRCFKHVDFGEVSSIGLHHFSEIFELGYGHCSYIRVVSKEVKSYYCLLLGKEELCQRSLSPFPG